MSALPFLENSKKHLLKEIDEIKTGKSFWLRDLYLAFLYWQLYRVENEIESVKNATSNN